MAEKMFYMILPKVLRDHVLGDLQEEFFEEVLPKYGPARTRWWYRGQVLKSIRYYILNRKGDIMFFIFSVLVFVALSVLAAILGSGFIPLINIPSIIVVIIPAFVFAIAATSFRSWTLSLKLIFIDEEHSGRKRDSGSIEVFKRLWQYVCGNGSVLYHIGCNTDASHRYDSRSICSFSPYAVL